MSPWDIYPPKDVAEECSKEEIRDQGFPEDVRFLQNIFGSTKIEVVSSPFQRNGLWVAQDWKDGTGVPAERFVVIHTGLFSLKPESLLSFSSAFH